MAIRKKLGFALGSGGSRGVAHIGFLQAMEDNGIKPDLISGSSMGSVVGAAYAKGLSPEEMKSAVLDLKPFNLIDLTVRPGGLFDSRRMRKVLEKYIGDIQFSNLKIPFCCVAVDLYSQSVVTFKEGSVLDAVVASSSIPAIFKPIDKDGMRLVDGGILERVPVYQLKKLGANKIVAVDVLGFREVEQIQNKNTIATMLDVIDVMDNYRTKRRKEENKNRINLWIEPDLGDMSQYTFKSFPFAYDQGYRAGLDNVDKIKELLR